MSSVTCANLKIILVDDFSTSDAANEIHGLKDEFRHLDIVIISGKFGSPGIARNAGLNLVKDGWVAFWDSDDLPHPDLIFSEILKLDSQAKLLVGNYLTFQGDDFICEEPINRRPPRKIDIALNPGLWRWVFQYSLISDLQFSESKLGEDQIFLARVLMKKQKMSKSVETFYNYQVNRPNSLTNSRVLDKKSEIRKSIKVLVILALKSKMYPMILAFLLRMCLTLFKETYHAH